MTAPDLTAKPASPDSRFRVAINGYGRIGRCYLRALHEAGLAERFRIVAINEPADLASITYLTRFDSTHGRFPEPVGSKESSLLISGHEITVTHASTPEGVDWGALGIDLLVECSGQYGGREACSASCTPGVHDCCSRTPATAARTLMQPWCSGSMKGI